jgi:pyruvate dehydrogenase E1 component alpha subunit/2-oxoisovalerate dehydrogenase E1 component
MCENNRYAMGTALSLSESEPDIASKASSYAIDSCQVDGMNVVDVEAAVAAALETVRVQGKPYLLECLTYRFKGHSMFDSELYREKDEVKKWQEDGPIQRLSGWLRDNQLLTDNQLAMMEYEIKSEIQQAIKFAEQGEWEATTDLYRDVYTPEALP